MAEEKNDMFSEESGVPDNKKILDYLQGSLSDAERSHLDGQVPDNPFLQDAVEGLQNVPDRDELPELIGHLNHQLHRQLKTKKSRGRKKQAKFGEWIYWAILIILTLGIIGFVVLRFLLK
jgi:hypothetical protein